MFSIYKKDVTSSCEYALTQFSSPPTTNNLRSYQSYVSGGCPICKLDLHSPNAFHIIIVLQFICQEIVEVPQRDLLSVVKFTLGKQRNVYICIIKD